MTQSMLLTLGLAIAGQILYQIAQRSVPADASPPVVLALAYFAASAVCVALSWLFGALTSGANLRSTLAWPTWLIAAAIVAIEVGYLLAYRSGWTLGTAFATASTVTVVTLALLGWIALGNALSVRQCVGLACCCLGVWLLSASR
jgi:drug/metabolite transporter (DMT)-like permease